MLADELVEFAKTESIELTDEQLDAISGGYHWVCDCDSLGGPGAGGNS